MAVFLLHRRYCQIQVPQPSSLGKSDTILLENDVPDAPVAPDPCVPR